MHAYGASRTTALAAVTCLWHAGEARTRTRRAVERTVPFALLIHALVIIWYARHGHRPQIITARRASQPWYTTKTGPEVPRGTSTDLLAAEHKLYAARGMTGHLLPGGD